MESIAKVLDKPAEAIEIGKQHPGVVRLSTYAIAASTI